MINGKGVPKQFQVFQVEHNVNCVVVGFVGDMDAVEKKGITGLEKVWIRH